MAFTFTLDAASHQRRLGGMEARDSTASNGDEHDRPNRGSFRMHVSEADFRNGISLRKEHGPNTNSHKDQAETKERIELTDDLINRQEGCNEVVDQQDNQPEVEALGRDLGQKASRARRESNTDEDQEDNGESTHDMSHGIAEVLPYDFGNDGGTIISFRQQPRNKVVDTACKTVPKVIQRNTAGPYIAPAKAPKIGPSPAMFSSWIKKTRPVPIGT